MTYVLVITGTRNGRTDTWQQADAVVEERGRPRLVVLGGDVNGKRKFSRGVDRQAHEWCTVRGLPFHIEYASWDWGHHAGPRRNQDMANHVVPGEPAVCLALPDENSRGTHDCASKCEARGAEVRYR